MLKQILKNNAFYINIKKKRAASAAFFVFKKSSNARNVPHKSLALDVSRRP